MEWKADFAAMAAYEEKRWARADRGKAFVGQLRRRILRPKSQAEEAGAPEAHDKKYKPNDALRDLFAEARRSPESRIDGQCRVRFAKLKESVKEDRHEHPNGQPVSDELMAMRTKGAVDDVLERRVAMHFEVIDENETGSRARGVSRIPPRRSDRVRARRRYVAPAKLHETLEEYGCTVDHTDLEKLCVHETKNSRGAMSVDDMIMLVAKNPVLGEMMDEAGLHENSSSFVPDDDQDACSAFVQKQTRVDVEAKKRDARAWFWERLEAMMGEYGWESVIRRPPSFFSWHPRLPA